MAQLEHIEAIEKRLWGAADTLRANSNYASNEYFLPVMGLIFLRHAFSRFLNVKDKIEATLPKRGGKTRALTKEDFSQKGAIFLRPEAQFDSMPKPIGRAWFVTEQPWRMITAVDVTIARPDPNIVNPLYYLYHLNSPMHIARCELRATGATRPRVSRKNMGALPILIPPNPIQSAFGEFAAKINRQRQILMKQNIQLVQARDLLLPRLMNGEIAV